MENESKINLLLIPLLVVTLAVAGFIGYSFYNSNKKVEVPDFLAKNVQEANEWCGKLESKYSCEFVYEPSTSVDKDIIFQQSISAGNTLENKITFTVSSGLIKEIALPQITDSTTEADIKNWASQNLILSVSFVEEENEKEKGTILRIEPTEKIYTTTPVTVYVSSGPKEEKPAETDTNGNIKVSYGDYINMTVSEFETKVKALGLVPNHKTEKDAKSSTVTKGNIVWHGSGTYEKGEKINYGVCTEKTESDSIVIKQGDFVGKTEEEFKKKATELGLVATHVSDRDEYSDKVSKGDIVTHGYGTYTKGEEFKYGVSLGLKDSNSIVITDGKYVGKSEEDFKKAATDLGLVAKHISDRDKYSDTVPKGYIVTHGYGTYEKGEDFNYGLSLGKEGATSDIVVKEGKYVGKTEEEFKKIATELGLVATHISSRDAYSDTVAKGSIVTHGFGTYESNEAFNYGLSLGKKNATSETVTVKSGQYIGKSESDFKTIANNLGLTPTHKTDRDSYSDTVEKGNIVTHGYGTYVQGEAFNYGLSLGKKSSSTTTTVEVVSGYVGKTENEFVTYLQAAGLKGQRAGVEYSDDYASGVVISYNAGTYELGDTVSYKISNGKKPVSTAVLNNFADISSQILSTGSYDNAVTKMKNYLDGAGFTNYTITGDTSYDYDAGVLLSIKVNGNAHNTRAEYNTDAKIEVVICNGKKDG